MLGKPGPDVWKGLLGDQEHRNELAVSACAIRIAIHTSVAYDVPPMNCGAVSALMERAMGIEPTSEAWEAYDITQKHAGLAAFSQVLKALNWKIIENGKWRPLLINPEH